MNNQILFAIKSLEKKVVNLYSKLRNMDSRPYKVYTARIVANGSSDPTLFIMENTIGDIVWTEVSSGTYTGTLAGAFTESKTWGMIGSYLPITSAWEIRSLARYSDDVIELYNMGSAGPIAGTMTQCSIEIRVYN